MPVLPPCGRPWVRASLYFYERGASFEKPWEPMVYNAVGYVGTSVLQ